MVWFSSFQIFQLRSFGQKCKIQAVQQLFGWQCTLYLQRKLREIPALIHLKRKGFHAWIWVDLHSELCKSNGYWVTVKVNAAIMASIQHPFAQVCGDFLISHQIVFFFFFILWLFYLHEGLYSVHTGGKRLGFLNTLISRQSIEQSAKRCVIHFTL